jgi:hypothetical protein
MKKWFIVPLGALLIHAGAASASLHLGVSQSDEKAFAFVSAPGIVFGKSFEWHPSSRVSLACQLDLHYRRIALKDKLVWHYPGILSLYDLTVKSLYGEVPLLAGYTFPIGRSWMRIYAGPSLHLCLSGAVQRAQIRVVDDSRAWGDSAPIPEHDCSFIEDPGPAVALNNSAFGFNLGVATSWSDRTIGFLYTWSRLDELDAVRINKQYHTICLLIWF